MGEFAYTNVTGKIKEILSKIRTVGVPPKVTIAWLKTIGFASSNDRTLMGVIQFIGFTDNNNIPTSVWNAYRGRDHKKVLGEAIKKGYAELFSVYPDANSRSNEDLQHVFRTSSNAGSQVISRTIQTFKALVDEADFSGITEHLMETGPLHEPPLERSTTNTRPTLRPEVHIDIQIHISPESSEKQVDKIFESMAKHLYGRAGGEV